MNRWWLSWLLVGAMALGANPALAKRLGNGASVGKAPVAASRASDAPAAPPAAAVATAPSAGLSTPPQRSWTGMLGGVVAGLGLAWLASSMGGQSWLQMLVLASLLLGGWLLLRRFLRRAPAPLVPAGMLAAAGAGSPVAMPKGYSPKNVGNDASARPWETVPDTAAATDVTCRVPAGFDTEGFLRASKTNFVSLQDAWDRSDIPSLRAMMTDNMLAEIQAQLSERERSGAGLNKTEVVMLEARLLGLEELEEAYLASVEFSGLIREDPSAGPNPFREIWNITRPKSGESGWLVAGVQALQ